MEEISLACTENEGGSCAVKLAQNNWDDILKDFQARGKFPPPVAKDLGNTRESTDKKTIFVNPKGMISRCSDYQTIFDPLQSHLDMGCAYYAEIVSLSGHGAHHKLLVERNQKEEGTYLNAVKNGILKAGKKPNPFTVKNLENIISDILIDWHLFDGNVDGQIKHSNLRKWSRKILYDKEMSQNTERSLINAQQAILDELSDGYMQVDDSQVKDVKEEAITILDGKLQDRDAWPQVFTDLAELFAKNFETPEIESYQPDFTSEPVDSDNFTLPQKVLKDSDFGPGDMQIILDAINGGKFGDKNTIPPSQDYTLEGLLVYYRNFLTYLHFKPLKLPEKHTVRVDRELWSPEKKPNFIDSINKAIYTPNNGKPLNATIVPYLNLYSDVRGEQKGPDMLTKKKPLLLVIKDESGSMTSYSKKTGSGEPHEKDTLMWYANIGTMNAVRNAVNGGMKCCVMGFGANGQFHVNAGRGYSEKPFTRNVNSLDEACVHFFNGGSTYLPDTQKIVGKRGRTPVLSLLYTDGVIHNLDEQINDLKSLTKGDNQLVSFLIGTGSRNKSTFQDLGAITYVPDDLNDLMNKMHQITNNVYGGVE